MKKSLRAFGLVLIRKFGTRLRDAETGKDLGRVGLIPWKGKIHVIGLRENVRPVFLTQTRLTYWKQELGFTTHPPPDFSRSEGARPEES